MRGIQITFKGVPVLFHWSLLLCLPLFYAATKSIIATCAGFASFILLFVSHEAGHALMARRFRLRVYSVEIFLIHGRCKIDRPRRLEDHVAIAWSGVLMQIVLLLVLMGLSIICRALNVRIPNALGAAFFVLGPINLGTAVINLIPRGQSDGVLAWKILPIAYSTAARKLRAR